MLLPLTNAESINVRHLLLAFRLPPSPSIHDSLLGSLLNLDRPLYRTILSDTPAITVPPFTVRIDRAVLDRIASLFRHHLTIYLLVRS